MMQEILELTLSTLKLGCRILNLQGLESIAMEQLLSMVSSKMIDFSWMLIIAKAECLQASVLQDLLQHK